MPRFKFLSGTRKLTGRKYPSFASPSSRTRLVAIGTFVRTRYITHGVRILRYMCVYEEGSRLCGAGTRGEKSFIKYVSVSVTRRESGRCIGVYTVAFYPTWGTAGTPRPPSFIFALLDEAEFLSARFIARRVWANFIFYRDNPRRETRDSVVYSRTWIDNSVDTAETFLDASFVLSLSLERRLVQQKHY